MVGPRTWELAAEIKEKTKKRTKLEGKNYVNAEVGVTPRGTGEGTTPPRATAQQWALSIWSSSIAIRAPHHSVSAITCSGPSLGPRLVCSRVAFPLFPLTKFGVRVSLNWSSLSTLVRVVPHIVSPGFAPSDAAAPAETNIQFAFRSMCVPISRCWELFRHTCVRQSMCLPSRAHQQEGLNLGRFFCTGVSNLLSVSPYCRLKSFPEVGGGGGGGEAAH